MEEAKNQSKLILFVLIIIVLVLVNIGIFYTGRISKLTAEYTKTAQTTSAQPIILNTSILNKISNRLKVNVEPALAPYSDGRINPFTNL